MAPSRSCGAGRGGATTPWGGALDEAYQRSAPSLAARGPGGAERGSAGSPEREGVDSVLFAPPTVLAFPWSQRYPTARYVELLTTQSDHRLLPPPEREQLLRAVAEIVDAGGGALTVDYVTRVHLARAAPPGERPRT